MQWFDNWFLKKSQWAWEERNKPSPINVYEDRKIGHALSIHTSDIQVKGMQFVIYPAAGGHIVEYRSYNEKTDRNEGKLHIITTEDDIGQSLGHIVTLEYLRK